MEAVRRASRGEVFFSEEQRARARCWREEVGARWERLTRREQKVLRLLAEGLDNAAIAEALCVTVRTVECHVTSILSKLEVASRLEAAVWVHDHLPDDLWKSTRCKSWFSTMTNLQKCGRVNLPPGSPVSISTTGGLKCASRSSFQCSCC